MNTVHRWMNKIITFIIFFLIRSKHWQVYKLLKVNPDTAVFRFGVFHIKQIIIIKGNLHQSNEAEFTSFCKNQFYIYVIL